MNDRFKFRVFSKGTKELLFVLTLGGDFIKATPSLVVTSCRTLKADNCILEQSTGLKDKHGRLIYEGDIVEHDTAAGPKRWPVVFRDGCFVLPYESGDAWLAKVIAHCPYESGVRVVGNTHENTDLLEEGK